MSADLTFLDYKWADGTLSCGDLPIRLPPKEALVLRELLHNPNRIISSTRLIDAAWSGGVVGQQSLNRAIAGLRARLPEIGRHIVTHHRQGYCLELDVAGANAASPPPPDSEATGAVTRALARLGLQSEECCAAALHALRQPALANLNREDVHGAIADIEVARIQLGHASPRSGAAAAVSAARRRLSLNPANGRALSVVGWCEVVVNDRPDGLATLEDALKAAPDDPVVRSHYGWALRHSGELAAATDELRRASDMASDVATLALFAFNRLAHGEVSLARELAEESLAADPYEQRTLLISAIIASRLDDHAAAIGYAHRLLEVRSRNVAHSRAFLAFLLHRGGHEAEAASLLAEAMDDRTHFRHSTFAVPALLAIRGEREAAFMLDRARAAGCPHRRWLLHAVDLGWLTEVD